METHVRIASLDLLQSHLRHGYVVVPLGRQTTEVRISISRHFHFRNPFPTFRMRNAGPGDSND